MAYPIKITKKTEALPLAIIGAAWAAAGYFYAHFPEQVANHWNFAGHPDAYAGKLQGAIAIPILLSAMYAMFLALPMLDPKKDRYSDFEKVYLGIRGATLGLLAAVYGMTGLYNLGYPIQVGYATSFLVGLLMIVMGNYMGKIKKNWFVGIKTPWTLSSENVWNKTHRAGGWAFVAFGLATMAAPYLPEQLGLGVFMGGAMLASVGTMAYSYWLYRQEQK